ncbi:MULTISPECIES: hypothetical protein [unclassified Variovorax]|uniref:hypothetical protein n=1 Tax=unclassified Variovorax TaxID=663243 RepID=UPI00076DAE08|nr:MULTISPECIES: hypothetical protein [unclassified Variovorax]KWT98301.1 hypothetical protein APY03_0436 [Variovorax sp. WDL1]PNG50044.1 hypothetical protein CHC06_05625 [Variovorax sp. B2]PNG50916.1 hypothetical protein CHC07_05530 [Variovorax sp. B4]VTU41575.1 hypothetical protein SRS16P1_00038 [Variovorax sp. SRS16]VTU41605.1 hypothetical protein E5P1_00038 [Variovorax sp. PBL-E5]
MTAAATTKQQPKTTYFYKLFRVKRSDGRVTTVSLNPLLVTQACRAVPGGLPSVNKLVREAAARFETGMYKNCSGYVSKQLTAAVEVALVERRSNRVANDAMNAVAA